MGTGVNQCGLCIPENSFSIVLDLKRMDRILEIDEVNMTARIQPYVSIARLQAETMKRGLWNGGTPLAPSTCSEISNILFMGIWQSCLAYGAGLRSLVNLTIVLPNGDMLRTGSSALPNADGFLWYGPGPDIKGVFEFGSCGEFGVITEATVKLYPWVGGEWQTEAVYDKPPLPRNHHIYFIEFPDSESMKRALYEISHSGIATHLHAMCNAYNACYTQPTQELTVKKFKEGLFPEHLVYCITAGISSPKQLEYEEKV